MTRLAFLWCLAGLIAFGGGLKGAPVRSSMAAPGIVVRDTLSIVAYGARSGGKTLNTHSIQGAIDACHDGGGGVVLVPAGEWLTGPIVLKSGVNLRLSDGALLQFTREFNQYPLIKGNFEGLAAVRNQPPIWADGADDIAITGRGVIDGGGDAWRPLKKSKAPPSVWATQLASGGVLSADGKTWWPSAGAVLGSQTKDPGVWKDGATIHDYDNIKDFLRPNLIVLDGCKNVLLEGVTFRNSPAWCLHPLLCTRLTIRGIAVKNPPYAQNGDGIDIESCSDVLVEKSSFDAGDDGICLKSGRDEEGRKRGVPTQRVIIRDCVVYHAHGGFVIGSEMSGGVRDVEVYNCSFQGTDVGLRFKSARGRGGVVENINVHDIFMKDIAGEAILFDMYYMAQDLVPRPGEVRAAPKVELVPVDEGTPRFRNFQVRNIVCSGAAKGIFIRGLPEMNIQDVVLEHLSLKATEGMACQDASRITLKDVRLDATETKPLIRINDSKDILIDSLQYPVGTKELYKAEGSSGVVVTHAVPEGSGGGVVTHAVPEGSGVATQALVVDPSGNGNFTTIQSAINSLSDDSAAMRVIFIRKGVYDEKLMLSKSHVELLGEDSATTIITQSIARDIWRCSGHADDWGVATMNLSGSDITLAHLTIQNEYGFEHLSDTTVPCPTGGPTGVPAAGSQGTTAGSQGVSSGPAERKVSRDGHQMALRSFHTTRLKVLHCLLRSYGGDTVSPWNAQDGLFYFKDCTMEGGVDFYCPRGWAYAEGCRFIAHTGTACIWHDGSGDPDEKTVLKNCSFDGFDGFHLGRYHKDAQFYLLDCRFGRNMADARIALVKTDGVIRWGERVFYYDCHREGGDYAWFSDNLKQAPGDISAAWVFGTRWNPVNN